MTPPTVLVTGGAGYIGSHFVLRLTEAGHEAVVYDNLSTGHDWAVKWGPLERGDLLDQARLEAVLRDHRPAAVMHFAAKSLVAESFADPLGYYRNNVTGTLNLLAALSRAGAPPLVFSSTCAVYGAPRQIPMAEDHPCDPTTPYGASKLMIERMLWDLEPAEGLKAVALRYFNAAGADPEGRIGELHEPESHLIPNVLRVAAGSESQITIYGDDYDTPDGTAIRDYIHVEDLARAHVAALAYLRDGGASRALNLGTGSGASVRQVVSAAEAVTGRTLPVEVGPRRPADAERLVADAG
ncbi:MAG: UDP-glucose 4-epimerase GalE, partial [Kiloniellales bacterium]|nr:UDP-glucose 4-epimerase GalE [Kiloniellales bacterium]